MFMLFIMIKDGNEQKMEMSKRWKFYMHRKNNSINSIVQIENFHVYKEDMIC